MIIKMLAYFLFVISVGSGLACAVAAYHYCVTDIGEMMIPQPRTYLPSLLTTTCTVFNELEFHVFPST